MQSSMIITNCGGLIRRSSVKMFSQGLKGFPILRDPMRNKGLAFRPDERVELNLSGLLPALGSFGNNASMTDYLENLSMTRLDRFTDELDKYDWLMHLYDTNRELFFRLLSKHADALMPLVYTPTVGLACQNLSLVYSHGRGLFITINDKGKIASILKNWPSQDIRAICVTDGERILGLGDQGAFGMGIPVGKLSLYTGLAGIPPQNLLPVCLDVGTNSEKYLEDPLYFGLKQNRVTGQEYDDFIDEFMQACVNTFGQHVLIQFEDFANHNAFRLLHKYNQRYSTFNDDIQGTASVVLSGLLASQQLTGRKLNEEIILCYGSGEAAIGFSQLVQLALVKRFNMTPDEAKKHLYLVDSKGLVVEGRKSGGLTKHKLEFARPAGTPELTSLEEVIKYTKCTALLGAAAVPRVFTPAILNLMAELNEKPLIMALSNPTSKAECTAEEAYKYTHGRCVFASGSPFLPLTLTPQQCPALKSNLVRHPGQANNSYIFPGVALGIISGQLYPVVNEDFLVASEALASLVQQSDYDLGRLFPPLSDIRRVSSTIAYEIIKNAATQGRCKAINDSHPNKKTIEVLVSKYSQYPPGNA